MADLGEVGELIQAHRVYELGRIAFSLSREANPIRGVLVDESFPYFPDDTVPTPPDRLDKPFTFGLGRTAYALDKITNPVEGVMFCELFPYYPEDLVSVAGVVIVNEPTLASVQLKQYPTGRLVGTATPNSAGAWNIKVPAGKYWLTYHKQGCEPVCHGEYIIQ